MKIPEFWMVPEVMSEIKSYETTQTQPTHLPQGFGTFSNYHDASQAHKHPLHKLGNANTGVDYHLHYQTLDPYQNGTANGAASNTYLTTSFVPVETKCIIMKYRTGTLHNQKHTVWFKRSTSLTCLLRPHLDSALHLLSGCQHTKIWIVEIDRHNLACMLSMIIKAISKTGSLGRILKQELCFHGYTRQ